MEVDGHDDKDYAENGNDDDNDDDDLSGQGHIVDVDDRDE